jgi:thiopurine S-methyltransferase
MDKEFWLERWRTNQIGFHQTDFNARLTRYWPSLGVRRGACVFVPLCGKTRDMLWLAQQGHAVLGIELSTTAIEAFFAEAGAPYECRQRGVFGCYEAGRIGILNGDFFQLAPLDLSDVAAVFDRASLVALPPDVRRRYAEHLLTILPLGAQMLLLTIEYDQAGASGPPFAVHPDEVAALFGARCEVELLERTPAQQMPPRFQAQGISEASESTYRIVKDR